MYKGFKQIKIGDAMFKGIEIKEKKQPNKAKMIQSPSSQVHYTTSNTTVTIGYLLWLQPIF